MIAYISIGARDINRSKRFYDAALEPLGYKYLRAARSMIGYGYGRDSIALWVLQAERPIPADEKSGLHFCFAAGFRRRRCVSHGGTSLRRTGQRCTPSASDLRPRLLGSLHHRSGRLCG
jgi:hypothetical protein